MGSLLRRYKALTNGFSNHINQRVSSNELLSSPTITTTTLQLSPDSSPLPVKPQVVILEEEHVSKFNSFSFRGSLYKVVVGFNIVSAAADHEEEEVILADAVDHKEEEDVADHEEKEVVLAGAVDDDDEEEDVVDHEEEEDVAIPASMVARQEEEKEEEEDVAVNHGPMVAGQEEEKEK